MQKDRKKIHKEIVKYMRKRNKELAADEYVGLNRFRIDLLREYGYKYSDNSGWYLRLFFKLTDNLTNNTAVFICSNYDYEWKIFEYANDFLIRCSDGRSGHYPHLHYAAYDVHEIIPYKGSIYINKPEPEDGVINTYSWLER